MLVHRVRAAQLPATRIEQLTGVTRNRREPRIKGGKACGTRINVTIVPFVNVGPGSTPIHAFEHPVTAVVQIEGVGKYAIGGDFLVSCSRASYAKHPSWKFPAH